MRRKAGYNISSTPYDDVFRTMLKKCRELVVLAVNEIFGENHGSAEEIMFLRNEHFIFRKNDDRKKWISDSCMYIEDKRYHLECESHPKGNLAMRMLHYDFGMALDSAAFEVDSVSDAGNRAGKVWQMAWPESAVLHLRGRKKNVEELTVRMTGGKSGSWEYRTMAVFIQDYTLEKIFEKRLLFFLPFYIFRYESELNEPEETEYRRQELVDIYSGIFAGMEAMTENGELSPDTLMNLRDMMRIVARSFLKKHRKLLEGVESIMGGKVLETAVERITRESEAGGEAAGEVRGRIIESICIYCEEMHLAKEEVMVKIMARFNLDKEEAERYMEQGY